jgi:hypothetical protein
MTEAKVLLQVDIKQIYSILCSECQFRLRQLLKDAVSEEVVRQALGEKKQEEVR